VERLLAIDGVKIAVPEGAFYVLPDMSAFFGPGVSVEGFGEIPDSDALCRYFIEVARVSACGSCRACADVDRCRRGFD
jgi:aspartate/glutamate/aspartate-prephenate aminotransferase